MHASLSWSLRSVAWTWFANSRLAFVEESNGLARGKVAAPGKNGTKAERERKRGLGTAWLTGLGPLNICLEACTLWGFDCFGTRVEDRFNDRRPIPLRKSRARICSERRADSAAPYRVASLSGPRIFCTITRIFWEFFWTRLKQDELFLRVSSSGKKFEEELLLVSHDTNLYSSFDSHLTINSVTVTIRWIASIFHFLIPYVSYFFSPLSNQFPMKRMSRKIFSITFVSTV